MIWIFNLERASASACDNYNDVFYYICNLEKQNLINFSHDLKQDLSCLEFASEADKKQWCLEFCHKHNYDIIETPSCAVNSSHSTLALQSPWLSEERYKQAG